MAGQRGRGRIMRMAAERRAATLVVRLTTAKTQLQLLNVVPALPRLRALPYDQSTVSRFAIAHVAPTSCDFRTLAFDLSPRDLGSVAIDVAAAVSLPQ